MNKKPDWSILDLYSRAFNIVKKYKVTWAFGMALALTSMTHLNGGGSSNNSNQEKTTEQITQILGASTNSPLQTISSQIIAQIPVSFYIILGIEIAIVLGTFFVIFLIFRAWSEASLTHSTHHADLGKKPLMAESSEAAFSNIKSLIWLYIVPGLVVLGIASLIGVVGVFLFWAFTNITPLVILFLIPLVIIMIIGLIFLLLSMIWASRITVLENLPAWQSLKKGFQITRKKKWSMILLGIVNSIISTAAIFVPIILGILIFLVGVFLYFLNHSLLPTLISLGGILIIVLMGGMFLLSGIIEAWKNAIWTIAYREIKGKYD